MSLLKVRNERVGDGPTAMEKVGRPQLIVCNWLEHSGTQSRRLDGDFIDGLDEAMDKAIAYVKRCQDKSGKFAYKER